MQKQTYIISDVESFEPKHIFDCGQCFRWNKQQDESYTGVFGKNVINVKKEGSKIIFKGITDGNIEEVCNQYFDLDRDYKQIKLKLSAIDDNMKASIQYGQGIRLLNQDLWETIISFIISANNNIPRIKGIIEKICKTYGEKIIFEGKEYYTFPTPDELSKAEVVDLRKLGLGFRDTRVYETTRKIVNKDVDLQKLHENNDTNCVREVLLTLPGVGPKVADCILLFSTLKRLEAFPIDVWVRRVINELYIKNGNEEKVNKKEIEQIAKAKYGNLAGIGEIYIALVKGIVKENQATINMPIGRSTKDRKKMAVNKKGKEAITHFKVIERFPKYNCTLLEIKIETGRTHQIRVHLSEIGYPVIGDEVYSNGKNQWNIKGQCLHAKSLKFKHPVTKKEMFIEAELPKYFKDIIEQMRQRGTGL